MVGKYGKSAHDDIEIDVSNKRGDWRAGFIKIE